jgi:hypothetical protein
LENQQEPLRLLASNSQREARKAREDRDEYTNTLTKSDIQPTTLQYNKAKLDLATTRAALSDTKEELSAHKDTIAKLQLQLDRDQELIRGKDRTIANLLAEIEESTSKIELLRSGGKLVDDEPARSTTLSRMMGSRQGSGNVSPQNDSAVTELLSSQLKEAVLEREKLKLQLEEEREKNADLKAQSRFAPPTKANSDTDTDVDESVPIAKSRRAPSRQRSPISSPRALQSPRSPRNSPRPRRALARPSVSDDDSLATLQNEIDQFLGTEEEAYAPSHLADRIRLLLDRCEDLSEKTKIAVRELAIANDQVEDSRKQLKKVEEDHEYELMELELKIRELKAERDSTKREVQNSEKSSERVLELEKIIEEQTVHLKKLTLNKESDMLAHQQDLENSRNTLQAEIKKLKEQHKMEIEKIESDAQANLISKEKEWESSRQKIIEKYEADIEDLATTVRSGLTSDLNEKLKAQEEKHRAAMQENLDLLELEKAQFKVDFQKQMMEAKKRTDAAEQNLKQIEKQLEEETSKYQSKLGQLEEEVAKNAQRNSESAKEWINQKQKLSEVIDDLHDEIDTLQNKVDELSRVLEIKSRELNEIESMHETELKRISNDHKAQLIKLEGIVETLKLKIDEYEQEKEALGSKLGTSLADLDNVKSDMSNLEQRANKEIAESRDSLAEATAQLERVQRVLKDVNSDVDRYKKMADERDEEIIALKRQVIFAKIVAPKRKRNHRRPRFWKSHIIKRQTNNER